MFFSMERLGATERVAAHRKNASRATLSSLVYPLRLRADSCLSDVQADLLLRAFLGLHHWHFA